jgi:hypothetical protein
LQMCRAVLANSNLNKGKRKTWEKIFKDLGEMIVELPGPQELELRDDSLRSNRGEGRP